MPLFSLPLRPWEPGRTVVFLIHDDLQPEHVDVQLILDLRMKGRTVAWVRPADSLLQHFPVQLSGLLGFRLSCLRCALA